MDQSIRAAEDMMAASGKAIKLTVDLTTVVLRFVGHSAMGMAAMVAAHMKGSRKKEMGEISVRAMVKRQEPFDMIALEPHDATKFQELANQVGLLYSIREDTPDYDGMQVDGLTSVLFRQQDAPLVRSIMERLQISSLCSAQTAAMYPYEPQQSQTQAQTQTQSQPYAQSQQSGVPPVSTDTPPYPMPAQVPPQSSMTQIEHDMYQQMQTNLAPSQSSHELLVEDGEPEPAKKAEPLVQETSPAERSGTDPMWTVPELEVPPIPEESKEKKPLFPQQEQESAPTPSMPSIFGVQAELTKQMERNLKKPVQRGRAAEL